MPETISATEARVNFGRIMKQLTTTNHPVVVERSGEKQIVMLSLAQYEQLVARASVNSDWQQRLADLHDRIRMENADKVLPDPAELIMQCAMSVMHSWGPPMVCIDASFVVRLLVETTDSRWVDQWAVWDSAGEAFVAPSLFHYEVTNALFQYVKADILSAETVRQQQALALSLPIQLVGSTHVHRRAFELAEAWKLGATYDAHYLAVAERFNCNLWSSDAKLARHVKEYTDLVRLLK